LCNGRTCAIDINGELVYIEEMIDELIRYDNTTVIAFLDCDREKKLIGFGANAQIPSSPQINSQYAVFYGCKDG